jgi:hypothetical protein
MQSMQLASRFIEVGMPYIASFLPSDSISYNKVSNDDNGSSYDEIRLMEGLSNKELSEAKKELEEIAKSVRWEVSPDIFSSTMPSWGRNILAQQTQPWSFENAEQMRASDKILKDQGKTRRSIVVGIAAQYIDTIVGNPENSETHLRAVWHAALTLIHEIGHIKWNHDFKHVPDNGEPYVGDMCWAELGIAFSSWLFSGCTPTTIPTVHSLEDPFDRPLIWRHDKTLRDVEQLGAENRPCYVTYWSISTSYLEDTLQQEFWDELGKGEKKGFSAKARAMLKPTVIFGTPKPATLMIPDFNYDGKHPPRWISECLDRGL